MRCLSDYTGSGPIWLSVEDGLESLSRLPNPREAYRLSITKNQILIQAQAAHGLFNGVQTLLQLLPPIPAEEIRLESLQVTHFYQPVHAMPQACAITPTISRV